MLYALLIGIGICALFVFVVYIFAITERIYHVYNIETCEGNTPFLIDVFTDKQEAINFKNTLLGEKYITVSYSIPIKKYL